MGLYLSQRAQDELEGIFPEQPCQTKSSVPTLSISNLVEGETAPVAKKESVLKLEKMERCRLECSQILPHVFVGGQAVAENKAILDEHKITHAINCASDYVCSPFEPDIIYLDLPLSDTPSQPLLSFLPRSNAFIEEALEQEGANVFIYCIQGVSRSVSVCMAYLLFKDPGLTVTEAWQFVKARRAVASPNLGFMAQLTEYSAQLQGKKGTEEEDVEVKEEEGVKTVEEDEEKEEDETEDEEEKKEERFSFFIFDREQEEAKWVPLGVIDEQDLQTSCLVVIYKMGEASLREGWLWVGAEAASEEGADILRKLPDRLVSTPIEKEWVIEKEGEESDAFWDMLDGL